jgi:hypothetical protein
MGMDFSLAARFVGRAMKELYLILERVHYLDLSWISIVAIDTK